MGTRAELQRDYFYLWTVFLLAVWLCFCSLGFFAVHIVLCQRFMCGVPIAPVLAWMTLTATFTYVMVEKGCVGTGYFLCLWSILSFFLSLGSPTVRAKGQSLFHRVAFVVDRLVLRLRHLSQRIRRDVRDAEVPLTRINLSVRLVSGDFVDLPGFLSHERVACVAELVERRLSWVGTDSCELLCGDRVLTRSARLSDEGVTDGAELTVVIAEHPPVVCPDQGVEAHPNPPRATPFLCLWLCMLFFLVEMRAAYTLDVTMFRSEL